MLSISQELVVTAHTLICRQPSTGKTEVFTYSPESGTVVSSLRGLINWAGQARWQLDCRLSGHRSALSFSAGVQAESFTRVKLFSQLPATQIFQRQIPSKGSPPVLPNCAFGWDSRVTTVAPIVFSRLTGRKMSMSLQRTKSTLSLRWLIKPVLNLNLTV